MDRAEPPWTRRARLQDGAPAPRGTSRLGRWIAWAGAGCLAALLGACTLLKLSEQSRSYYDSTILVGRIEVPPGWSGPVVVAAYRRHGGKPPEIVHHTLLHEPGGFELIVPKGEFALFAFGDTNGNGIYDPDEPAGDYAGAAPVAAPGLGVISALHFVIGHEPGARRGLPPGTRFPPPGAAAHSTQAGALMQLDASQFSAQNGNRGYWAPMDFYRETGGNVYFLEPYDAGKTPILFVHGAAGSAQDWRYFVEHIDRSRFQPWIFQYPSGASVDSMAHLLFWKLFNLQLKHRYRQLYIVAHSMGGLVVRAFLLDHGHLFPQVKLFVSLSTPWAGEVTADLGVKHSPAVVPSWHDMQPDGAFMKSLFARPLPGGVAYYLLFGHRGGYSMLRPNNDGTVTLASQLRSPAQAEAKMIYGFDEDHVSILSSPQVLSQFNAILDSLGQRRPTEADSGHVQVHFAVDSPDGAARCLPMLLLRPVGSPPGRSSDAVTVSLAAEDSGRVVGPLPPGAYEASLIANGFRSEPQATRIQVAADSIATMAFRLRPQGVLVAYVGDDGDVQPSPAGAFRRPHPTIRIQRITLRGAGVQRVLVPRHTGTPNVVEAYLRGEDDAYGALFSFVGLPAGEVELSIDVEGYRPYTARHTVVPGLQNPQVPIVLQRL